MTLSIEPKKDVAVGPQGKRPARKDGTAAERGQASLFFDVVHVPEVESVSASEIARPARAAAGGSGARGGRVAVGAVALFVGVFLLAAHGVRMLVPWPSDLGNDVRMRVFEQHKDEYDAVYIGPSTVYRSFRPDVIDPIVSKAGRPFRSFQLGFGGMLGYEQSFYIREILAMQPRKLRWIFVEPSQFVTDPTMFNLYSERGVFRSDLTTTREVLRGIALSTDDWQERARLWAGHLKAWSWRLANLGKGPAIVASMLRRHLDADAIEEEIVLKQGGFQDEDDPFGRHHRGFSLFEQPPPIDPKVYYQDLKTLATRNQGRFNLSSFDIESLREQRRVVEGAGLELIYIVPSLYQPVPWITALNAQGEMGTLMAFNSPTDYPKLYRLRDRIDPVHVNRQGAAAFSLEFAKRLAEMWAGASAAPEGTR